MKFGFKIISYIIVFALGAILFHSKSTPQKKCIQQLPTKTVSYPVVTYAPVVQKKFENTTDTLKITIPEKIDSVSVVKDYFQKRYYNDTLINDTNAFVAVSDIVFRNRIISRSVQKKFYTHTYTITPAAKIHLFTGIAIGGNANHFSFAPTLILQDKHQRLFGINYDLLQKQIFISAYLKIK